MFETLMPSGGTLRVVLEHPLLPPGGGFLLLAGFLLWAARPVGALRSI